MANRQGRPTSRRGGSTGQGRQKSKAAEGGGNRNAQRREQYANDPGHRDKLKRDSRQAYRQNNPARSPIGLAQAGTEKEVMTRTMDHPVVAEVFTIPEASKALGKSPLTVKRWISDDLIPPPVLEDTVYGYKHYSRGELEIIMELLQQFSQDYTYLVSANSPFVHSVRQRLEHYRRTKV